MNTFPVVSSILAPNILAPYVQDVYNLDTGVTCKLLKAGVNHSYLINDQGRQKYVFRVYSFGWRNRLEIEEELRLLNLLKDNNIPVSYALPDSDGIYVQEIYAPEGMRYGVLFTYADGEKLLNFPADVHYSVGRIMAQIHQLTEGFSLKRNTYTAELMLQRSVEQIKDFLPESSAEMHWMLSTQQTLLKLWAHADDSQLRKGAVHMDLWFDNMNITAEGKINLFDFDFCGNGWLCLDIAYYILQLYSTEKVNTERNEKLNSFLAGYESISPINDEERRLLPMLGVSMYFFYLGVQCERFENWSNVFLNETHLKRFINLLVKKYFDDHVLTS
ncbi:phosphotransferase [Mucilaginibacter sp. 21P]|uniref:phosphotransferase n=1 Tax=Mucilaginibacter sp. 21P TaxID=2778902 RepID=UPI001C583C7B|nr:phosphotransferase [Mucilaginibacter sp. 21P]QXV66548.1 phosphotransferase [Mucilaginibacter sp. 21P]